MILDILSWITISVGCLLGIVGGIGLIRFPDFYSRLHAAGITDTLCASLILLGLGLQSGLSFESLKLFLIYAFLFLQALPPVIHWVTGHGSQASCHSRTLWLM